MLIENMAPAENDSQSKTVLVKGISFDANEASISKLFSAIGPVETATLVKRGRDGSHKGFGFVKFAQEKDAQQAVAALNRTQFKGRELAVQISTTAAPSPPPKRKHKDDATTTPASSSKRKKPTTNTNTKATKPSLPSDDAPDTTTTTKQPTVPIKDNPVHKYLRTVAIGGLTPQTKDPAIQLAQSLGEGDGGVEDVIRDNIAADMLKRYKLIEDGCSGETALIVYCSIKAAVAGVAGLHGKSVSPLLSKPSKKTRRHKDGRGGDDGNDDADGGGEVNIWARQVSGEGLHLKRWRLIIRNLRFSVNEQAIRAAFVPAGFVWEVTIPRDVDGKSRGFAFVGFICRAHAERGVKSVNGKAIEGRVVAVDWAVSKNEFDKKDDVEDEEEEEGVGTGKKKGGDGKMGNKLGIDDDDDMDHVEPDEERNMMHSVIDDLLMKEEREKEDKKEEEEEEDEPPPPQQQQQRSIAPLDPNPYPHLTTTTQGLKPLLPPASVEDGVTVFIRGLPLDLVKDQLYSKMKTYGRVRSCRLVKDKTTGKLKGTAFVDFVDTSSAEKVAEVCSKWRSKQGPGVIVAGIVVECDVAVNADAARDLAVAARGGDSSVGNGGIGDKKGASKRNLHLSKEGVIVEGSTAWQDLSESDKAKRKRAQEEKKTKLVSPNFIISPTRLSVRNIPRSWTEKQLKALFIQGVKERSTKANPKVVQVKILTSEPGGAAGAAEKGGKRGAAAGAAGGESKSKGIGFVEFADHEHALCALRQLNNNPKIWGKDRRPIIEFAIDNVKMLKARETNLARQTRSATTGGAGGGDGDRREREAEKKKKKNDKDRQDDGPKSKRKLRKERGEMLKQRAKEQESDGGGEKSTPESTSSKSQRRRQQRKKAKGGDVGAGTGGDAAETSPVLKFKAASGIVVKSTSATGRAARTSRAKIRKAAAAAAVTGSGGGGGGVRADQKRHTRRERQDALVDKLATLPKREMAGGVKKRRAGVEKQDGLDKLAKSYFGGGDKKDDGQKNKKKTTKAMEVGKAVNGDAFKRWFE
jgi:nucleolar protein 4